jgi:hypothetical protein
LKFALTANHAVSTKLTADIELTAPITISGDGAITLDLAGKTIKPASSYSAVRLLNVLSGGSLTINDSSTDAKGAIISNGVEAINHVIDWTNAKVVINGGNYSDLIPLKVLGNNAKVNVTLAKDQVISSPINIGNSATNNVIKATVTIDFNSKKVSASKDIFTTANPGKFNIRGASDVTFKGPGKIEARTDDAYAVNVYNGTLSIEGDLDVEGNVTVIRVQTGQLNIAGGTYKLRQLHSTLGRRYMLNCIDANYANGSAKIEVTGGTFYGFDPANSDSENPKASFVKTGYKSTQSTNTVQDEFHTSEQIYTYTVSAESE